MRRTRKYRFACSLARHLGLTLRGRDAEHAVLYSNLERRGYTWDPKMAKAGGWFREAERDPPARASRSSPCSPPPTQTPPARATAEAPQLHPCATCQSMPLLVRGFCPVCPQCRTKVCRDCGKALPNGRIYIVCRGCQRRKKPRVPAPTPASSAASTTPAGTVEQDLRARVAVLEGQVARFELELASLRLTLSGKHLGDDPGELGPLFKIDMEGAPRGE